MRQVLLSTLVAGAVAGLALFALLNPIEAGSSQAFTTILVAALSFALPGIVVFLWISRRSGRLRMLSELARQLAQRHGAVLLPAKRKESDIDELQRSVEVLGELLTRESGASRQQRAAFDQIVENLHEGFLAVSAAGRVVQANSRALEMFGARGPVEGRSVLEVVRKRVVSEAVDLALRERPSADRVVVTTDNEERHIDVRAIPLHSSPGIAAVALFNDRSDLIRLQRVRRDFLDDFSHEVRTPLAGLRSAAETIEAGRLPPEQEEALRQVMLRQLNRIERLVKDLAELNRIESGELVLERRRVDLEGLLLDLVNDFRGRLPAAATAIALDGQQVFAFADPVRLQQIFSNLLDNAWKHGGGGQISIKLTTEAAEAVVRVSDSGEGIPPAEIDRVFNRFYRVDRSRSQAVPGVGLGLAITKHLVLLHGGSIRAFNQAGRGATFEVRLPAA